MISFPFRYATEWFVSSLAGILIGAALNGTDGAINMVLAFPHLVIYLSFCRFPVHRHAKLAVHSSFSGTFRYRGGYE